MIFPRPLVENIKCRACAIAAMRPSSGALRLGRGTQDRAYPADESVVAGRKPRCASTGFTVTAASASDYRPRPDRRVARSKARSDRKVRRKEAHERADEASALMDARTRAHGGRSKACRGRKKFTVDMDGGGRIETRRKKHREKGNTLSRTTQRGEESER